MSLAHHLHVVGADADGQPVATLPTAGLPIWVAVMVP